MIITKNESRSIERCIKSFIEYVDEILISDTGSTDDTVRIAKSLGAKVSTQKWENDFSLARNRLLDEAGSGGWILFLDADEFLEGGSAKRLRHRLESLDNDKSYDALWVRLVNLEQNGTKGESVPLVRVFRASDEIRYTGAIHETLRKNGKPLRAAALPEDEVVVLHDGYTGARTREKAKRNIVLLENPCGLDEGVRLFHLGKAYISAGKESEALDCFLKYLEIDSDSSPVTLNAIIESLGLCERLLNTKANYLIQTALRLFPEHPAPHLFEGDRLYAQNLLEDALNVYMTAFEKDLPKLDFSANLPKDILHRARLRAANILYLKGKPLDAADILCQSEISRDIAGVELLVRCLGTGEPDFAIKYLDSVIACDDPQSLRILLDALYGYSCGMLFLVYFERYYQVTGIRDSHFSIMQAIVGEHTAAVNNLSAQCKLICPFSSMPSNGKALMNSEGFARYDAQRRRILAAALMSGKEQLIQYARFYFDEDIGAAIDIALGKEVDALAHSSLEVCLGVFSEMLRLGGFSGAAHVWLEVLLLFGGNVRLRAAELLDDTGFSVDALELISDYPDADTKKDAMFFALRICVRLRLSEPAKNYSALGKRYGCEDALYEQFSRWAEQQDNHRQSQ